jgi:uncharacterized hydrophobic protein (TIGR00341 family)
VPLRLLELTIPDGEAERLADLLEDIPVLHLWATESGEANDFIRVLVEAQHVEAVSDVLVNHYGPRDDFRLISLAVEATVPAVPPPESEGTEGDESEKGKKEPQRISREELYEDLAEAAKLTNLYLVMVALSTVVAAVGLIRGDIAIVIGAMVIAPLLGPNIALSLACTLGDPDLAKRSLRAVGAGVAVAAALSMLVGAVLVVDPSTPAIAARTQASFADIILALAAGAAGTLAFTSGVPAVVVGVMVAVALLPPLVTAGLLAGSGHWTLASGAFMLVVTNVTCINLAATATFLIQKVRPRTWWEAERAKKATRLAMVTWIIMLAVLLILMFLNQMRAA